MAYTHDAGQLPNDLKQRLLEVQRQARLQPARWPHDLPDQLFLAVVRGLPPQDVLRASLGPAPKGWGRGGAGSHDWAYINLRSAVDNNPHTYAVQWEAEIAAGAYREAASLLHLPSLAGVSVGVTYPHGKDAVPFIHTIGRDSGITAISEAAATNRIKNHLSGQKRFIDWRLAFVQGLQAAPVVTLRFRTPDEFASAREALPFVFGATTDYEGVLLKVVDDHGKLLRVASVANRTGVNAGSDPRSH